MKFLEMDAAIDEARQTLNNADLLANKLASLLVGRMRKVSNEWVLVQLKRELQHFDARSKKWRR